MNLESILLLTSRAMCISLDRDSKTITLDMPYLFHLFLSKKYVATTIFCKLSNSCMSGLTKYSNNNINIMKMAIAVS